MVCFLVFCMILFSSIGAQDYCAGDQISIEDQNLVHVVGAGNDDYQEGDEFRLADFNGDLNGGSYSVIFIDMSASW